MLSSRTEDNLRDEEKVGENEHAGEKEHADTNQHGSGADPSAEQSQGSDALTQALTDMYKAVENMSSEGPGCDQDALRSVVAVIDPLVKVVRTPPQHQQSLISLEMGVALVLVVTLSLSQLPPLYFLSFNNL